MKSLVLNIGVLILFSVCAFAQNTSSEEIKKLRIRSNEAIAKHDTASLGVYWAEDLHVLTSRSTSLTTRLANQRAFQTEFDTKEKLLYVRTPNTIEMFPAWNMASEYGKWVGTWTSNGVSIKVSGSYYAKWHKVNGAWKIRSEIYTPTECNGGDYCKEFALQNNVANIVVQNFYFPKPGKENEVLAQRKLASSVRAKLGLPAGRILLRTSESTSQAYIIWECEYSSLKSREEDVAKLDLSAEFKQVQEHMGTLLEKFDRSVWQVIR